MLPLRARELDASCRAPDYRPETEAGLRLESLDCPQIRQTQEARRGRRLSAQGRPARGCALARTRVLPPPLEHIARCLQIRRPDGDQQAAGACALTHVEASRGRAVHDCFCSRGRSARACAVPRLRQSRRTRGRVRRPSPNCALATTDGRRQTTADSRRRASPTDESRTTGNANLELLLLARLASCPATMSDFATVGTGVRVVQPGVCRRKREKSLPAAFSWMLAEEPDVDPARVPEATRAPIGGHRRRDRH
jgi:hypothetical protein